MMKTLQSKRRKASISGNTKANTMNEIQSAKGPVAVRCTFSELRPINGILPNPRNPNRHPKKQLEKLAAIYPITGVRKAAIVSKRSGLLVTGHGSVEAARLIGMEAFPIDVQDFKDEQQEHAHMVADNQIADLAEIDETELAGLLAEMNKAQADVAGLTGFDQNEIDAFLNPGAGKSGNRKVNVQGVIQYNIVFDNLEQQEAWFRLIRQIKENYPDESLTIGGRLEKFINLCLNTNGQS
jgi:hypothetical protein